MDDQPQVLDNAIYRLEAAKQAQNAALAEWTATEAAETSLDLAAG